MRLFGLRRVKPGKISALCGSAVRGILGVEEPGLTFPRMLLALAPLLIGCATPTALPTAGRAAPEKFVVRASQYAFTTDFEVAKDDALVEDLVGLRDVVFETLQLPASSKLIRVVIFDSLESYARFLDANHPDLPKRRAFFIQHGEDLVVLTRMGDDLKEDLRHEAVHALLHSTLPTMPLWLDEGLAEYFEDGPGREAGKPQHIAALKSAAAKGWKPNLNRLEQLRDLPQMSAADYRESWLWVHYLLHRTPTTKRVLVDYLAAVRRGETKSLRSLLEVADPNYATGVAQHLASLTTDVLPPAEDFYPRHSGGFLGGVKRLLGRQQ